MVRGVSGTRGGGIRNERPGRRKTSTTATTSASVAAQIAASSAIEVGRRTPRASAKVSVSALKTRSATSRARSDPVCW